MKKIRDPRIKKRNLIWFNDDWNTLDYASTQSWGEDYQVAISGSGRNFHYPILTYVPGFVEAKYGSPKWDILQVAGIEYHLHGKCRTSFWSPGWQLKTIGFLRALGPLAKVPYLACQKCAWPRSIRSHLQEENAWLEKALVD